MLFTSLILIAFLLDNPNAPIGRTEPVRPTFDFHAQPPLNAWNRIQPDLDRSSGRIVDEPTYQLDRGQMLRALDRAPFDPGSAMRVFEMDRDRWLRIDQRQLDMVRLSRRSADAQREAKMQLKEYELFIEAGSDVSGSVAAQAEADRAALERLRLDRDARVNASNGDQHAIAAINRAFQSERARILGFDPATTQPTTAPSN